MQRIIVMPGGRVTTFAVLAVAFVTACSPASARPSPTATTSPKATISAVASPNSALTRVPATGLTKTVYLTFDDGPNPTWTAEILTLLEENQVHASFFVVGKNATAWPWLIQREARDGDTVGDHSWSHPNLTALSMSAVSAQLSRDKTLITMLTGTAPTLWRPPYEAFNPSVLAIAKGLGMKMQLWSTTTGDWQLPGTEVIVLRVMSELHNGMVVLFHDAGGNRSETVAAVAMLIPELEAAGYRLAALPAQGMGW